MRSAATLLVLAIVLTVPAASSPGHYVSRPGDYFYYTETTVLQGQPYTNYSGYSEHTFVNGSIHVLTVAANGTASAVYGNNDTWWNISGTEWKWSSSGGFTFSTSSFLYVSGTDNQTGYTMPYVWFYVNNSLPTGAAFYLLNSRLSVFSRDYAYALDTAVGASVATIAATGSGSYLRDDVYGRFNATYTWTEYFDPATGYVVGYLYTETDSDSQGNVFTITDLLQVTATSYPLTAATAASGTSPGGLSALEIAAIVVIVIVAIVVIVVLLLRARRSSGLPRHSTRGEIQFTVPPPVAPPAGAPPPIRLTPSGQPAVQQIVIKETVKVKCAYCGSLIDSTAERCPFCGATRS